jgi:hypothetical protein
VAKKKKRRKSPTIYPDQAGVCRRLGITPRTLQRDMKDPGFPDCSAGYDVEAIREYRQSRTRPETDARDEARELDLQTKRHRKEQERLKAEKMRHQLEEYEGELLPRRTVEFAITSILLRIGDWANQLPELTRNVCCNGCRDAVEKFLTNELNQKPRAQIPYPRSVSDLSDGRTQAVGPRSEAQFC